MSRAKESTIRRIRWVWWGKWSGVLVCVLIVGLWVFSAFRGIIWLRDASDGSSRFLLVMGGAVQFQTMSFPVPGPLGTSPTSRPITTTRSEWDLIPIDPPRWIAAALPQFDQGGFIFPLWIPIVMTALPTWGLFVIDKRRDRHGLCAKCGYDLRGNTRGRCPECGEEAVIVKTSE